MYITVPDCMRIMPLAHAHVSDSPCCSWIAFAAAKREVSHQARTPANVCVV